MTTDSFLPSFCRWAFLGCCMGLASCSNMPDIKTLNPFGATNVPSQASPEASLPRNMMRDGEVIGSGPVRATLILPLTGPSGPTLVGASLRNAAELALLESRSQELTLTIRDDQSTPLGARNAAQAALADKSELIMGPLFSQNVREVGRIVKSDARSVPVIAFSTDSSTASRGIYLLSFSVESDVERVVDFAAQKGQKSFAALVPEDEYGRIAEAAFLQAAAQSHVRVQQIEHYQRTPASLKEAVDRLALNMAQFDTLFIPEQAEGMVNLVPHLRRANLVSPRVQLLGTGVWNDPRVWKMAELKGSYFASPDTQGFSAFSQRYRARYGTDPTRVATLSYDAVSLAANLARGENRNALTHYPESTLTHPNGFQGIDGLFRFKADGLNNRGLSVLQIESGNIHIVSPAPRNFD